MSSRRPPTRGSVGDGGDPKLPGNPTSDVPIAIEDAGDRSGMSAGWGNGGDGTVAERFEDWRRRYIPLPDEVIHQYLGEGEHVIHYDHPSFRAFLVKNLALVILLPIVGPIFVAFFRGGGLNWISIAIFLFLDAVVAILALRRLGDRYTNYVITNVRLIRLKGIISRKVNSIPWTRMTGLGFEQGAMGRVLGYATIHIESANEESGLRKFSDINDPTTFHQRLLDMISAKTGQSSSGSPPPPTKGERRSFFQKRKQRRAAGSQGVRRGRSRPGFGDWGPTDPSSARAGRRTGAATHPAPTAGSWASGTWSAARSAVRGGLHWPGRPGPGSDEPDDPGQAGEPEGPASPAAPSGPPPPPSMRPPYRGRPDQRPPSAHETIVISTTSRPRSPKGQELPKAGTEGEAADDDTLEQELDEDEE
jgi:membrane protein YdbS with pleckstrin-like domain